MDVPRRVEQVDEAIASLVSTNTPMAVNGKSAASAPTIIAVNPRMKKILAYAEQVAPSDLNVLLTGETGTGKDLLARYIHDMSGRPGEFVVVNAAAIPNEMIESELFGYAEGAFTGARKHKPGRFELANNGTFYLNEIVAASPQFHAQLLEVLETHQVWRLGETSIRHVNFRLIAARNRDINRLMAENRFREDLYHRLNEVMIDLPPLRDRTDNIPALVEHFLPNSKAASKVGTRSARDLERLSAILSIYDYPGNVRQLKAKMKQLVKSSNGDINEMIHITLKDDSITERDRLSRVLESTNRNRSRASWILDVSECTIRNWINKHQLTPM
jgi:transcriptional regulator with PAS, ATPase and Fis domain